MRDILRVERFRPGGFPAYCPRPGAKVNLRDAYLHSRFDSPRLNRLSFTQGVNRGQPQRGGTAILSRASCVGGTDICPIPGFCEPVSSLTHLVGAGVFALLSIFLLGRGRTDLGRRFALGVFAFSCVLLLSISGVYHLLSMGGGGRLVLQRLDHAAIFVLIAGTYTPVNILLFRGWWRWVPLLLIWSAAIAAVTLKSVLFNDVPEWLSISLYLSMGWFGAVVGYAIWRRFGLSFIKALLWGGLAYTGGAVLDYLRWPTLVPGIVGPHELFHVFVLAGVGFHWGFVFRCAVDYPSRASLELHERKLRRPRQLIETCAGE
jgi:channel protein (hemolysin III family)